MSGSTTWPTTPRARLTDFPGTDQHPVWFEDKIFFVSDRDLTLNVYSFDLTNDRIEQVTHHRDYDVLWPSGRNGQLVYENGGYLYKLDLASGREQKLVVNLNFDNAGLLPYFKQVAEFISSYDISPSGKRAVFDARGDLFTVPEKEGLTYNLTNSQGVREISPAWSPDGKSIAYYSDLSGEYEIYLVDGNGGGQPRQLTSGQPHLALPAQVVARRAPAALCRPRPAAAGPGRGQPRRDRRGPRPPPRPDRLQLVARFALAGLQQGRRQRPGRHLGLFAGTEKGLSS